jgi:hypothetical protein
LGYFVVVMVSVAALVMECLQMQQRLAEMLKLLKRPSHVKFFVYSAQCYH